MTRKCLVLQHILGMKSYKSLPATTLSSHPDRHSYSNNNTRPSAALALLSPTNLHSFLIWLCCCYKDTQLVVNPSTPNIRLKPRACNLTIMKLQYVATLLLSVVGLSAAASTFSPARPPSIPLAVRSPYMSTWQNAGSDGGNGGYLAGQWPTFWMWVLFGHFHCRQVLISTLQGSNYGLDGYHSRWQHRLHLARSAFWTCFGQSNCLFIHIH